MNLPECRLPKTHKEIVRIMVFAIPCLKDGQATSNTKARAPLPGFSRVIWDEWGKKGVRMDTKALKKQMGAAIAMVLVAAVALGSATFAWFVSNNTVDATTTKISAQSNSAYLVIDNAAATKTSNTSTSSAVASEPFTDAKLYPAQWAQTFDANGKKSTDAGFTTAKYQFESAYAQSKEAAAEKNNTRFAVGDPAKAADLGYTLANKFFIGTGGYDGIFTNLKVTGVKVNNADSGLSSAMRVLVTCENQWVLWSSTQKITSSDGADGVIKADGISKGNDATVNVYVFYDGADDKVYTTNLENLKDCGVTVTFEATPKEYKK